MAATVGANLLEDEKVKLMQMVRAFLISRQPHLENKQCPLKN
jgi:hypothetical protein